MKRFINHHGKRTVLLTLGRAGKPGGWELEWSFSVRRRNKLALHSNYSVMPVTSMTVEQKFAYALKVYNCMLYNPSFEAVAEQVEKLKEATLEFGDVHEKETGTFGMLRKRQAENKLDHILQQLHCYVENVIDKERALILSAGMMPILNTMAQKEKLRSSLQLADAVKPNRVRKYILKIFL